MIQKIVHRLLNCEGHEKEFFVRCMLVVVPIRRGPDPIITIAKQDILESGFLLVDVDAEGSINSWEDAVVEVKIISCRNNFESSKDGQIFNELY